MATKFKERKDTLHLQRQKTVSRVCANVCDTFQLPPSFPGKAKQDTLIMHCNLPMKVKVTQSGPTLCNPMDYTVRTPWTIQSVEFSRSEYWSGQPFPFPGDILNPEIESRSPTLQADSLPAEPSGKPKNTGVGSLSLLQRIFLTQESNQDLLHCRWVLYQLSYQGSPGLGLGHDNKQVKNNLRR